MEIISLNIILFLTCLLHQTNSVLIVPAPTVTVQSASTTSVTLNWTMPMRELYDYFTLEVLIPNSQSRVITTKQLNATISDLVPGTLHMFFINATRGELTSDRSTVLQETVPLPPSNLRLEAFQSLTLSMQGVFGEISFNLNVPGIQAEWRGPPVGSCDCYQAEITPPDGRVARPEPNDRLLPGCLADVCEAPPSRISGEPTFENEIKNLVSSRKYLQLTSGQTYTIKIRSTTCGHGYLGRLKSSPINATITLPPSNPPPIIPMNVDSTSAYLSWEKGELPGFYDNFEVILSSHADNRIQIHIPVDPKIRGRNVSGLQPCKSYNFEVFTLYKTLRSEESQITEFFTRPASPFNLMVDDFNETSISVRWRYRGNNKARAFRISVENLLTFTTPSSSYKATISRLTPGTWHNISVSTICSEIDHVQSPSVWIPQVTIPVQPEEVLSSCTLTTPDENIRLRSTFPSLITLHWSPPSRGDWDGFVVDYSPFEFESYMGVSEPPLSLSRESRSLNITVPITGRFFTIYVRATRQHVFSEATISRVQCGNLGDREVQHCRARPLNFRIIITSFNASYLSVDIQGLRIENVTVELSDISSDLFVTSLNNFIVINPCLRVLNPDLLNVVVYPICDNGVFCRPIRRKLCATPPRDVQFGSRFLLAMNSCCSGRPYSTVEQQCCHGKLTRIPSMNGRCCYTKWYDNRRQKCCGINNKGGILVSSSKSCVQ